MTRRQNICKCQTDKKNNVIIQTEYIDITHPLSQADMAKMCENHRVQHTDNNTVILFIFIDFIRKKCMCGFLLKSEFRLRQMYTLYFLF